MNYFKNNKLLIWILLALLVINISAIGTIIYHVYYDKEPQGFRPDPNADAPLFLKERMQLNDRQWRDFRNYHREFRNASRELFSSMHEIRNDMLEEISLDNPDTAKLYELADKYGRMHANLKKKTMDHFLEMKKDISPDQERRMNEFLRNLMQHEGFGSHMPLEERKRRMHRWKKNRQ